MTQPTKGASASVKIAALLLAAVFSCFILSHAVPALFETVGVTQAIESSEQEVQRMALAAMTASLVISALPDDFASPIANSLAEMNKYFVLIFLAITLEKLLVTYGVRLAFLLLVPLACVLLALAVWKKWLPMRLFAQKLLVLAMAVVLVVPISTGAATAVEATIIGDLGQTITEMEQGAQTVDTTAQESATLLDKLGSGIRNAFVGAEKMVENFKALVQKYTRYVAVLIITKMLIPLATFAFFRWLLAELFRVSLPVPQPGPQAAALPKEVTVG